MSTDHFEFLVEEPSMEAFLRSLLPRILGAKISFEIYPYQGKSDLLARLEDRLRGYAAWLPETWRIVVVIDRDDDHCNELKSRFESVASIASLSTRKIAGSKWQVLFRIAIEELEAWYFGDWEAVRHAYPRASKDVPAKAAYRNSDRITGGTWEAFERELQRVGYFSGGLRKIEAARQIGRYFSAARCSSDSYRCLHNAFVEAAALGPPPIKQS